MLTLFAVVSLETMVDSMFLPFVTTPSYWHLCPFLIYFVYSHSPAFYLLMLFGVVVVWVWVWVCVLSFSLLPVCEASFTMSLSHKMIPFSLGHLKIHLNSIQFKGKLFHLCYCCTGWALFSLRIEPSAALYWSLPNIPLS